MRVRILKTILRKTQHTAVVTIITNKPARITETESSKSFQFHPGFVFLFDLHIRETHSHMFCPRTQSKTQKDSILSQNTAYTRCKSLSKIKNHKNKLMSSQHNCQCLRSNVEHKNHFWYDYSLTTQSSLTRPFSVRGSS